MSVIKSEMRDKAFRICRDYLNGAWKSISAQEMVLKQVSGGLSNFLYYCALPACVKSKHGEPSKVLVRFYGQIHGEGALEAILTESVIFTLLSERQLGPKLHGVFPGGRLEEFIPARPLKTKELSDPDISSIIGEKMAQIHSLDVPISKEPTWLWDTMDRWMKTTKMILSSPSAQAAPLKRVEAAEPPTEERIERMVRWHLDTEMEWMRQYLSRLRSPVVFCHNDLQEGNILIRENSKCRKDRLVIIDFEYCSYNYRGFDLANHFCESMFDYTVAKAPKFSYVPGNMPSVEQRLHFIRSYLNTWHRENTDTDLIWPRTGDDGETKAEVTLLREADCYVLASHFFWGLWAVVNATTSSIPFGYWDYAESRFTGYFEHKRALLDRYGQLGGKVED